MLNLLKAKSTSIAFKTLIISEVAQYAQYAQISTSMKAKGSFVLEKYKGRNSRFTCPQCKKPHEFTRYINETTGERLPDYVGICNRSDNCGYKYTASDYFKENPDKREGFTKIEVKPKLILPPSFIPREIYHESLTNYDSNNFFLVLKNLFGNSSAENLINKYRIGTYSRWAGANIFWQFDINDNIRTGKIMVYDPKTRNRIHGKQNWIHSTLGKKEFNLSQCLFGEHLLQDSELKEKPIGLVESEKTAVIASFFNDKLIWLATGGKQLFNPNSNPNKFKVLKGRIVMIYPDLGVKKPNNLTPYEDWTKKSEFLSYLGIKSIVSDFLETRASQEDREKGLDIADFLIKDFLKESS